MLAVELLACGGPTSLRRSGEARGDRAPREISVRKRFCLSGGKRRGQRLLRGVPFPPALPPFVPRPCPSAPHQTPLPPAPGHISTMMVHAAVFVHPHPSSRSTAG